MVSLEHHSVVILNNAAFVHTPMPPTPSLLSLSLSLTCSGIPQYKGRLEVAKLLLEQGANVNQARSDNGSTPLTYAAHNAHPEMIRLLLVRQPFSSFRTDFRAVLTSHATCHAPYDMLYFMPMLIGGDLVLGFRCCDRFVCCRTTMPIPTRRRPTTATPRWCCCRSSGTWRWSSSCLPAAPTPTSPPPTTAPPRSLLYGGLHIIWDRFSCNSQPPPAARRPPPPPPHPTRAVRHVLRATCGPGPGADRCLESDGVTNSGLQASQDAHLECVRTLLESGAEPNR